MDTSTDFSKLLEGIDTSNIDFSKMTWNFKKDYDLSIAGTGSVAGDTLILTENQGKVKIKDLVERFNNGEEFKVYSYNIETQEDEFVSVTSALKTKENATMAHLKGWLTSVGLDIDIDSWVCIRKGAKHDRGEHYEIINNLKDENVLSYYYVSSYYFTHDNHFVITPIEEKMDVYSLTVEKNQNFYAGGVLVHEYKEEEENNENIENENKKEE